ncbi:ComF family protein [Paenibacillus sp. GYB006]|uniref:ComF family protein n=1 Tax=Paenibacillus sp. GYB006 TaxID=2994394 RepID=UPI002F963C6B
MIRLDWVRSFLHGLAAPPGQICVACGNRGALSTALPGLCPRCVSSIPWIRNIRCHRCGRAIGCPDCARAENLGRSFEMNRSAVRYDPLMREWLAVYKYRGKERMAPLLGIMLGTAYRALRREMTLSPHMIWQAQAVTFVPVSRERYIERGFNQAERLAEVLSHEVRLPVIPMLMRTQHTEKQSYKSRKERVESMRNIFAVHEEAPIYMKKLLMNLPQNEKHQPIHLILVDDVYTTGSTLEACSQAMKRWGEERGILFKIYTLTWARS